MQPGALLWAAGQIVLALALVQWFVVLHECGHDTLFRTRRLHPIVGRIAGAFAAIPYACWTRIHGRHHRWTGWQDLDPARFEYIIDSMKNAAVYGEAQKLMGNKLVEVMTALGTGGTTETSPSGILYASGCVPHACGGADGFMAIDPKARKLYFAQQGDDPKRPSTWPDVSTWPAEIKALMIEGLER